MTRSVWFLIVVGLGVAGPSFAQVCDPAMPEPLEAISAAASAGSSGYASFRGYRYAKAVFARVFEAHHPQGGALTEEAMLLTAIDMDKAGDANKYLKEEELEKAALKVVTPVSTFYASDAEAIAALSTAYPGVDFAAMKTEAQALLQTSASDFASVVTKPIRFNELRTVGSEVLVYLDGGFRNEIESSDFIHYSVYRVENGAFRLFYSDSEENN